MKVTKINEYMKQKKDGRLAKYPKLYTRREGDFSHALLAQPGWNQFGKAKFVDGKMVMHLITEHPKSPDSWEADVYEQVVLLPSDYDEAKKVISDVLYAAMESTALAREEEDTRCRTFYEKRRGQQLYELGEKEHKFTALFQRLIDSAVAAGYTHDVNYVDFGCLQAKVVLVKGQRTLTVDKIIKWSKNDHYYCVCVRTGADMFADWCMSRCTVVDPCLDEMVFEIKTCNFMNASEAEEYAIKQLV